MLWLRLHIGGQRWGVYLVAPGSKHLHDEETGEQLLGRCVYSDCRIYIANNLEESLTEETLLHELFHALLFVTGADKVYRGGAKKDEQLVTALTPAAHRLFKDLGFRFPRGIFA